MRSYKGKDDENPWRITCFFVDKDYRGKGVAKEALDAALKAIRQRGGRAVEAYPIQAQKGKCHHRSFGMAP
jgi:GNAT superfamily N-acetyltransferase